MSETKIGADYDVAIIGLGPAGATLARLLGGTFRVVAIDKKSADGEGFSKPCGGLLAPDAQRAVSKLGFVLPKEVLVDPQIFAVKTIDLIRGLTRHYYRFYLNMDRHKFDMWLIAQIPRSVVIAAPATCTSISRSGNQFLISYKTKGRTETIHARYVIGADGANSIARRFLYPREKIRRYVSIQQWFEEKSLKPIYSCIFDRRLTDRYAWSISKNGYTILGGAFTPEGCRGKFEELKSKLAAVGFSLGEAVKTEACMINKSGIRGVRTGRGGVFLAGEAAGFISPSSLEGISWAIESARILAKSLTRNTPQRDYHLRTLGLRVKLLIKCVKALLIYNPLIRALIMRSGIDSITAD